MWDNVWLVGVPYVIIVGVLLIGMEVKRHMAKRGKSVVAVGNQWAKEIGRSISKK